MQLAHRYSKSQSIFMENNCYVNIYISERLPSLVSSGRTFMLLSRKSHRVKLLEEVLKSELETQPYAKIWTPDKSGACCCLLHSPWILLPPHKRKTTPPLFFHPPPKRKRKKEERKKLSAHARKQGTWIKIWWIFRQTRKENFSCFLLKEQSPPVVFFFMFFET